MCLISLKIWCAFHKYVHQIRSEFVVSVLKLTARNKVLIFAYFRYCRNLYLRLLLEAIWSEEFHATFTPSILPYKKHATSLLHTCNFLTAI